MKTQLVKKQRQICLRVYGYTVGLNQLSKNKMSIIFSKIINIGSIETETRCYFQVYVIDYGSA